MRKAFACDFETTTKTDDCRVWAWAFMEIGKKSKYKIGTSMNTFMAWVKGVKADLYFHNLKFDGSFIINYLLKNGYRYSKDKEPNTFDTIISNKGQWYMIDITYSQVGKNRLHTVIYDSLKKLPFTIKKIAKDFDLAVLKGDIDYNKEREVGYKLDENELDYVKKDVEILADALEIQFKQGLTKMTVGSDSMNSFKTIISKKQYERLFPKFSLELDKNLRLSYRGGFTYLNAKYANKIINGGVSYDVNSLYPSQMYSRPLPVGTPIYFEGKYKYDGEFPLYIQHIRCGFSLKKDHIPTIQIKKNILFKPNEYLETSNGDVVDLYVTNVDLHLIKSHYNLYDVEYLEGWKFKSMKGIFNKFIDKWTYVKVNNTGAKRLLAKLMLNNLYGKFASNPDVTGKDPYLKADGSLGFSLGVEEFKEPEYLPMGTFITSWARFTTISTAQKVYDRFIYADTDSIHLEGTKEPDVIKDIIDDKKLGYWANEGEYTRAKYIRQKTYVKEIEGKLEVVCAGMPDRIKEKVTFDNFKRGFTSNGKLMPKQVDGGVVLIDSEFTLK